MQGVRAARTLGSLHSQGLCLRRSLNYRLSKPSPTRLGGACAPAGIAQALHTGGRRGFLTTGMATDLGVGYEGGTPPCVAAFVTAPKDDDVGARHSTQRDSACITPTCFMTTSVVWSPKTLQR